MKKFLIPSVIALSMVVPLAHAAPNPAQGPQGSMARHYGDCPHAQMHQHHNKAPHRHFSGSPMIRTFGLNEVQAQVFMSRLEQVLQIQPQQKAAWDAMKVRYIGVVKAHQERRADRVKDDKPMTMQQRLEWRADHLQKQSVFLKNYAKDRAALEKVLTPEQMRDFDHAMVSGEVDLLPPRQRGSRN